MLGVVVAMTSGGGVETGGARGVEEIELGSWDGRGALELGGGGVQSYEKTLTGWFFKLRVALVEHSTVVVTGFPVATRSRRIVASRFLERAPEPVASSKCDGVRGSVLGIEVLLDHDRRLYRDEIATGATLVSSPGARHLRACLRDRLLPLPGAPIPGRLLKGVLQAAGVLEPLTQSNRGKRWGQQRCVICRALLSGLVLRGEGCISNDDFDFLSLRKLPGDSMAGRTRHSSVPIQDEELRRTASGQREVPAPQGPPVPPPPPLVDYGTCKDLYK
ncbi:hypothetical protein Taro_029285 [Colocasia esculenta]|uniref:Uncharacterized protein n=1 Tax=Colocasia esculenta TaxID=4460 RepID=A0A843VUF3_COLES|nr:hypothetical protein [Colocasia esculenta]